jgi:uncharacterized protein (DUF362 family)
MRKTIVHKTNLMIAGTDIVAVDAVACRIVGMNPERVLHIRRAAEQDVGLMDPCRLEIKGEDTGNVPLRCNVLSSQKEILV